MGNDYLARLDNWLFVVTNTVSGLGVCAAEGNVPKSERFEGCLTPSLYRNNAACAVLRGQNFPLHFQIPLPRELLGR